MQQKRISDATQIQILGRTIIYYIHNYSKYEDRPLAPPENV